MTRAIGWKCLGRICAISAMATPSAYAMATVQIESRGGTVDQQTGDMADMVRGRQMLSDTERTVRQRQIAASQNSARRAAKALPAVEADLIVGTPVYDLADQELGRINGAGPQGVELAIPNGTVSIPLAAVHKYRKQLLLKASKAEFDAQIAAARR